jgi:hypothetical protein
MELTRATGESLQPCLLPISTQPLAALGSDGRTHQGDRGRRDGNAPALPLPTAGSSETGLWDTQSGQILPLDG